MSEKTITSSRALLLASGKPHQALFFGLQRKTEKVTCFCTEEYIEWQSRHRFHVWSV